MLKRQKKHIDKVQGNTKHEAPRSVNYRATQNKNNIRTTALERSVVYTTGGLKAFHCTNFILGPDIILNTKMHKKFGFLFQCCGGEKKMGRCMCKGRLYLQTAMAQAGPYIKLHSLRCSQTPYMIKIRRVSPTS